jgi:hypothetical protein
MPELDTEELVTALGRSVVGAVSPADLPGFDLAATAYFGDPRRALAQGGETTQGSGIIATASAVLVPVVLYVGQRVVDHLADTAARRTDGAVRRWWQRRRPGKPATLADLPPLSEAQRQELDDLMVRCAVRYGVDAELAGRVSRAFLKELPRADHGSGTNQ